MRNPSSLGMKSMQRTALGKVITESLALFPSLEAAVILDFLPRESNFSPSEAGLSQGFLILAAKTP